MDIENLRAVSAVHTYGSYFEAAYQLSMEYSVLTKKVSKVEKEFGIRIFQRALRGHPLTLTTEGKAIINQIQRIVNDYDILTRSIGEMNVENRNVIRLGYWRSNATFKENYFTLKFFSEHSNYGLSRTISTQTDLCDALMAGKLDVLFITDCGEHVVNQVSSDFYNIVPLAGESSMNILVSEKHPLANRDILYKDDFKLLAKEKIIFDSRQNPKMPDIFLNFLGIKSSAKKIMIDYSDPAIAYSLVRQGEGIIPSARANIENEPGLKTIKLDGWKEKFILYMIYPKGRLTTPVRTFVDEAIEYYGETNKIYNT